MEVPPPQNVPSRQNHILQIVQGQTIVGSWADDCVVWAEGKGDDSQILGKGTQACSDGSSLRPLSKESNITLTGPQISRLRRL